MSEVPIPDHVRRFILTSIPTIPHLEALLLLRRETHTQWDAARVAGRLYISERKASELLSDLTQAGLLESEGETTMYRYMARSQEQVDLVTDVAAAYARSLLEVTNLIHGGSAVGPQQFADAFRFRKD